MAATLKRQKSGRPTGSVVQQPGKQAVVLWTNVSAGRLRTGQIQDGFRGENPAECCPLDVKWDKKRKAKDEEWKESVGHVEIGKTYRLSILETRHLGFQF